LRSEGGGELITTKRRRDRVLQLFVTGGGNPSRNRERGGAEEARRGGRQKAGKEERGVLEDADARAEVRLVGGISFLFPCVPDMWGPTSGTGCQLEGRSQVGKR